MDVSCIFGICSGRWCVLHGHLPFWQFFMQDTQHCFCFVSGCTALKLWSIFGLSLYSQFEVYARIFVFYVRFDEVQYPNAEKSGR